MPPKSPNGDLSDFAKEILALPGTEKLTPYEVWWASHFEWLKERGYMMRPRFRPGWKPSVDVSKVEDFWDYEDGVPLKVIAIFFVTMVVAYWSFLETRSHGRYPAFRLPHGRTETCQLCPGITTRNVLLE